MGAEESSFVIEKGGKINARHQMKRESPSLRFTLYALRFCALRYTPYAIPLCVSATTCGFTPHRTPSYSLPKHISVNLVAATDNRPPTGGIWSFK